MLGFMQVMNALWMNTWVLKGLNHSPSRKYFIVQAAQSL